MDYFIFFHRQLFSIKTVPVELLQLTYLHLYQEAAHQQRPSWNSALLFLIPGYVGMSVKESSGVVQVVAALGHLPSVKQDPLVMQPVPPAQGRMVTCLHTQMKHDSK
jgi:hypothetical protein